MNGQKKQNEKMPTQLKVLGNEQAIEIEGFDEVETPEADIVSLGSASYTKMLGKIYT